MTTPTRPVPVAVEQWIARSKYLRWIDGLSAWLVLVLLAVEAMPRQSIGPLALTSAGLLVLGVLLPPLRTRWRPISGWIGLAVSRSLRPGDRAWFVRDGRADSVLVTARHGVRLSIALPNLGEVESISVRRTRVFLVPW
ncbi:MAG: hypothetical protein DMD91_03060 [Candidatus Rokuibacteriota bacterium]|nr:MAG: hypothetical protein DMD91_03060 [Candidatus Rokubacteria bacterium]